MSNCLCGLEDKASGLRTGIVCPVHDHGALYEPDPDHPVHRDVLDKLLLEARSDEYGDSGNYNSAKLKSLIAAAIKNSNRALYEKLKDTEWYCDEAFRDYIDAELAALTTKEES